MRFRVEIKPLRRGPAIAFAEGIEATHARAAVEATAAAEGLPDARTVGISIHGPGGEHFRVQYRDARGRWRDVKAVACSLETEQERSARVRAAADAYFARHGRMP